MVYLNICLAGSIDLVSINEDGTLSIWDWKRSKDIKKTNIYESGYPPLDHLPNTNYWKYSMQLNIYKYILESKYDVTVKTLNLVILHPNSDNYKILNVPDLRDEVCDILKKFKINH